MAIRNPHAPENSRELPYTALYLPPQQLDISTGGGKDGCQRGLAETPPLEGIKKASAPSSVFLSWYPTLAPSFRIHLT